jgi:hypothetical protein
MNDYIHGFVMMVGTQGIEPIVCHLSFNDIGFTVQ